MEKSTLSSTGVSSTSSQTVALVPVSDMTSTMMNTSKVIRETDEEGEVVDVQLSNIVATFNIGMKIDLKRIAVKTRNAEYNPKRFSAVIMRIQEPKSTALIFESGKFIVNGTRTESDCKVACKKFAKIVSKIGYHGSFNNFEIKNISGKLDVKYPIQLESLSIVHGEFASYEPEIFPGLIYRLVSPKVVMLIFVSGKIIITGARTKNHIEQAIQKIKPVLEDFKKHEISPEIIQL